MQGFKFLVLLFITATALCQSTARPTMPSTTVAPQLNFTACMECVCSPPRPRSGGHIQQIQCSSKGLTTISKLKLYELRDHAITVSKIDLTYNNLTQILVSDLLPISSSLSTIDLRWNDIATVEDNSFAADEYQRLIILQLGYNNIGQLPDNALLELRLSTLDLSHNKLTEVPRALGRMNNIDTLFLNNNPIGDIDYTILRKPLGVSTLDLSACQLREVNVCAFSRDFTSSLNELYLDQNYLSLIKKDHFYCPNDDDLDDIPFLGSLRLLSIRYSRVKEIERRTFEKLPSLKRLYLAGNNFGVFKGRVFSQLRLDELELSYCNITDLKGVLFRDFDVDEIFLDHNNIEVLHHRDFRHLSGNTVTKMWLSNSNIREIKGQPFENLTKLSQLDLSHNKLDDKSMLAFSKAQEMYYLDLSHNYLTKIPNLPIQRFQHLSELYLGNNDIHEIRTSDLKDMHSLAVLMLPGNGVEHIDDDAFTHTPLMENLDIDDHFLKNLPQFTFTKLRTLYLQNGTLESLPAELCELCPSLTVLELAGNSLTTLPSFENCFSITVVVASENDISSIPDTIFRDLAALNIVDLSNNPLGHVSEGMFGGNLNLESLFLQNVSISSIPVDLFTTMPHLIHLDLSYNQLTTLPDGLFKDNAQFLVDLNFAHNSIEEFNYDVLPSNSTLGRLNLTSNKLHKVNFPTGGLLNLVELFLDHNEDLLQVPGIAQSPNLTMVSYSYAYHCCIWDEEVRKKLPPIVDHSLNNTAPTEIPTPEPIEFDTITINCVDGEITPEGKKLIEDTAAWFGFVVEYAPGCRYRLIDNSTVIATDDENINDFLGHHRIMNPPVINHEFGITCYPRPNELTPCTNLMDPWALRVLVWFVWVVALLGNGAVLFVAIAAKEKLEVYQFLICCLAFADFCMGIYLAFLAAVDIRTFGDVSFYQSALQWQRGAGCKAAGFIAVFASELSVFTLVILTLERVHTIAYTFNNNEKCKFRVAVLFTVIAVFVSAGLATLPLVGVNSYDKVAVCLPYLTDVWTDKFFIALILTINLVAFLVITLSYLYIFRSICKSPAAQRRKKDLTISAAKIAVLIITAFVCWIPIVIIGYLALGGHKAVDVLQAKYLIVLVYPLNACLNPFIYGIFTRQFRQKLSVLFKRHQNQSSSLPVSRHFSLRRGSTFSADPRGNPSPLELINLRQSRRSQSFSTHHDALRKSTSPPALSPPLAGPPPGAFMGRRASLPAAFGSSLHLPQLGISNMDASPPNTSACVPPLPFILSDHFGVSQPNLDVESNAVVLPSNLNSSLGGSQDSANRQLPGIPEEHESEHESVCSDDFCDAQEEITDIQSPTLEIDSELSGATSINSITQSSAEIRNIRESMDSAYSGCSNMTQDNLRIEDQLSPHFSTLSRGNDSFSSYDISTSDSEFHGHNETSDTLTQSVIETDLDQLNSQSHSPHHKFNSDRLKAKQKTQLNSPSHNYLASIGSETSV